MMSAIASVAAGFQIAASPIEVGNAVKWGATTPLVASLWLVPDQAECGNVPDTILEQGVELVPHPGLRLSMRRVRR
jgi:hypothetical protein